MRSNLTTVVFLFAALALATNAAFAEGAIITGIGRAKDGDSIWLGADKGRVDVRLYGIDAPEHDQECAAAGGGTWSCGAEASDALGKLADGKQLRCEVIALEPNGQHRPIAKCFVGEMNLNDEMVRLGLAWAFIEYLQQKPVEFEHFTRLEAQAKAQALKVWQAPTQTPRQFRAQRWDRYAARAPRKGCPVIGNKKSMIFHTPWSPNYASLFETLIGNPTDKTKVWFCTTDDAAAQGYKQAGVR